MRSDEVVRRAAVGLVGLLGPLGLLAVACGSEPATPASSSTTSPRPTTTAPTEPESDTTAPTGSSPPPSAPTDGDDEAAVLAAVDCYWDTIVEANDPPNPDHPGFDRCFTGPALERSRQRTVDHLAAGEIVKDPTGGTEQFGALISVSDDHALLTHCIIDDAIVYSAGGQVINDEVVSGQVQFSLVRVNGTWVVEDAEVLTREPGESGCDEFR